jgi:RNA polymerase primary sigma factor
MTQNEKNLELVRRIQSGDRTAETELLDANDGLVGAMLRRYVRNIHPGMIDDFQLEGRFALIRAAKKFDATRNCRFSTLATAYVKCVFNNLWRTDHRSRREKCVPLDSKLLPGCTYPDAAEDAEESENQTRSIQRALATLEDRDRKVVRCYFGLDGDGCTLESLGRELKYTKETIRQIKIRSLAKMKVELTKAEADL